MLMDEKHLFELKRQAVHMLAGLAVSGIVYNIKPLVGGYILIPMALLVTGLYVIPRVGAHLPVVSHLLHHFEREHDKKNFPFRGAFWYNLGIIPPVMLLPLNTACAVIVVLSIGDAMSTVFGRAYGKHKIGNKSVEGFLAFALFSAAAASFFVTPYVALALAIAGGLIEFIHWFDDNFLIPVGLTAIALVFGI